MKTYSRFSLFDRIVAGRSRYPVGAPEHSAPLRDALRAEAALRQGDLKGADLEQAYRDLLLQNQVLAESNERLHEKLARRETGQEDSAALQELLHAQRNALVERSHRLRELEYEHKNLQRQHKKLVEENRRLTARLEHRAADVRPNPQREAQIRRELERARAELQKKNQELLRLTDKYYQLASRLKPGPAPTPAANGDY